MESLQPRRIPAFLASIPLQSNNLRPSITTNTRPKRPHSSSFRPRPSMMVGSVPPPSERSVPKPITPLTPMDPTIGEETGVINADITIPQQQTTWLQSILSTRTQLSDNHPLQHIRDLCENDVNQLPLPGRKQESWRFTNLRPVYEARHISVSAPDITTQDKQFDIRQYAPDTAGIVLTFVDGIYNPDRSILSDDSAKDWLAAGGFFGSIKDFKRDPTYAVELLTKKELGAKEGGLFPIVGNAIAEDALVIDIPRGYAVSRPVAVVFLSTGGATSDRATVAATRMILLAAPGSSITLFEAHGSFDKADSFSLTLAGIAVEAQQDSKVSHYVLNDYGTDAQFLYNLHAEVRKNGSYLIRPIGIGSKIGRFTIGIDLEEDHSHGLIHSTLLADGYQIEDLHSRICHNAADTTSSQLQKNISSDHGRAIFNGKIIVTTEGSGTDSEQLCRSLLLSEKASVDAMPVLEIATDDVKCSHGATISDLEDDEMFYCQSRGLTRIQAQSLLIAGFALEALGDCPFPTLRSIVSTKVRELSNSAIRVEGAKGQFTSI